jgi:hypothetical protein
LPRPPKLVGCSTRRIRAFVDMRPRFCGITGWPLCDASQARQRCKAGRVRSCRAPPVAIRMRRILIPPGRCPPCPVKNETRRPCARSAGFNWLQPMSPSASVFLSLTAHTGLREHEHSKSQARALCKNFLRNYSGAWPALRHSCGDTGRTAREQVRHFRARLSGTPVAPWAAKPHGMISMGPLMPVTACAFSPARNRSQLGVLMGRARCRASPALARQKSFGFNLTRGGVAFIRAAV